MSDKSVVTAIVQKTLKAGYTISVSDGEKWPVKRSTNHHKILENLFATDEETIRVRDVSGTHIGDIYLVYGNESDGSEVVADYTDNETISELVRI